MKKCEYTLEKKIEMNDKLYIVIPAYNEEENIEKVVKDWYPIVEKYGEDSKIVVVDDGSRDSTYAKLQILAKDRPALIPLSKPNGGHGSAVLLGYQYSVRGGQIIFSRRIQTDKLRRMNFLHFGRCAVNGI